jgi:hypothetical protein
MAKKRRPQARILPRYEDTEDGPGSGRLIFPDGVPCDHCGKPVTNRGMLIVIEPEEGDPFWAGEHPRCAQRAHEIRIRRGRRWSSGNPPVNETLTKG